MEMETTKTNRMTFDEIKRKSNYLQQLRSGEKNFIKTLLEMGEVVETINNDSAENMPYIYEIDGVKIKYMVGRTGFEAIGLEGVRLRASNLVELKIIIDATRYLQKFNNKTTTIGPVYRDFSK